MRIERMTIALTTNGSGAATGYTQQPVTGRLLAIGYVKDDFADGHTATFTEEETGVVLGMTNALNASATVAPALPARSVADGNAMLHAAGGTAVPGGPPVVVNSRVKCVIASGGDTKSGTYYLYFAR